MSKLTQKRLKKLLHYNPENGFFYWKISRFGTKGIGSIAGCVYNNEYLVTMIDGKKYGNHRLAWLDIYGYLPENDIDHINRDPSDNRICNLREVNRQCNMRNSGNRADNTSGVKGVSWNKLKNKWIVIIAINSKNKSLGYYKDFDNAVCARLAGEQCLNWSGCDSNSPAYQYVQEMLKPKKNRKIVIKRRKKI